MARKDSKIAQKARIAVEKWRGYFKYNIDEYHKLHQFVLGKQWEEQEEDMLIKTLNKVPLQFNKLGTLINTLLGEQQQNTPQIDVVPLSNCDEETINLRRILVKDISLSTDAKTVYQVAAAQAFTGGFGAYLVDTDYVSNRSFEQDIVLRYMKDATRAYWDTGAEHINKIDGMCCGYLSRMSRKKFRAIYGKDIEDELWEGSGITQTKEEIALTVQPAATENPFAWFDDEAVTIMDHYERKFVNDKLFKLSNGRVLNLEEMEELKERSKAHRSFMLQQQEMMGQEAGFDMYFGEAEPAEEIAIEAGEEEALQEPEIMTLYDDGISVRIEDSKPYKRSMIMHYKIAGEFVLEESEFPAEDMPIIFVDQNSFYDKQGKQVCRSFIVDAVDAQRYLNYLGTQCAYILKISRYDQFMGSKKNVQGNDTAAQWRNPNNVKGMIIYDESPSGAKPEQIRPPELSASLMQQYERTIEDMYTSTGLYPARMGQQGNEVSGAAIDARTRQGSFSTYVAFNSINRAITAGAKIINQMIPRVYDSERVMNLMTPDKGRQNIKINEQVDEYGAQILRDVRKGEFDVILVAGPSYEGQKAQALESLQLAMQAKPEVFDLIADLYADNLPLNNTIEIKNRLKTLVPPDVIQAGKTGEAPQGQKQADPEQQAMMAEAQFKMQQIEIKKQELQLKLMEHQAKTEQMQIEMQIKMQEAAAELEGQKLRYLSETDRTRSDNAISHADNITKLLLGHVKESAANVKRENK